MAKTTLSETIGTLPAYRGRAFQYSNGVERVYGRWYNFGSNVSWARISPNGYRLRLDDTGEIVTPAGPAGRDACERALYYGRDDAPYAGYNFGPDYKTAAELLDEAGR